MAEQVALNGVDLSTLVRNVESLAGILRSPARRVEPVAVPGRHGDLGRLTHTYDANSFVLPMWVVGANPSTGVDLFGDAAVTSFYARVDELLALLHAPTLTFDHTLPDGSVRRAVAELTDEPVDFTRQLGSPLFGRVMVPLRIPSGFWVDTTTTTTQTVSGATGALLTFSSFVNATAPMDELTVTFGPSSNPKIQNGSIWLQYKGVIGDGRTYFFNSVDWTHGGTGGLAQNFANIAHVGSARWFELLPGTPLGTSPQVSLTHTGGGSASVTLSGRRKYLVG